MRIQTLYSSATIPGQPIAFEVKEKNQLLIVSGSMYFGGSDGLAAVDVFINAQASGTIAEFQNQGPRHLTFPTYFMPLTLPPTTPGNLHTLDFHKRTGTNSDVNDQFRVYLLEFTA